MKIIKVVHDSEGEMQQAALENYDSHALMKKLSPLINAQVVDSLLTVPVLFLGLPSSRDPLNPALLSIADSVAEAAAKRAVELLLEDVKSHLIPVINAIEVISLADAKRKYVDTANLSVGTYTFHPCDSQRLARLEHFHKNLALEKDDELVVLLGRMGARSVRITETDSRRKVGVASFALETIALNGQAGASLAENIERSQDLLVRFEGHEVEISPDLLKSSLWFSADSRLNAILESRKFSCNKMQQYTLVNTYSETFDFDFKLAAKHLVVDADLRAEYQTISNRERLFHVEFGH